MKRINNLFNHKRASFEFFVLVFVALFTFAFTTFAQSIYYLDKDNPNASDSNAGTNPSSPWLTWNKAVNTAQAGDVVIVKKSASPYIPSGHTSFNKSGTSTNRIIFKGEDPNNIPVIDYQGNKNLSANNVQYITWEYLKLMNTGNGFWTEGSDYLIMRGLVIDGVSSGSTLRFQGDYNLVEYCEITGSKWNAITIMSHSKNTPNTDDDWRCRGNIIRYNYIHDNTSHHSINIFPYVSPGGSDLLPQYIDSTEIYGNRLENSNWGIYSRYMRAFKIYNNLIVNCTEGGIQLERNYDSGNAGSPDSSRYGTYDAKGGLIANNTIYNSKGTYGCAIDNRACNNVKFYNNAIWNSASTSGGVQWRFYNPTASSAPSPFNVHPVSNLIIDHNMTSNEGGVYWNGGSTTSLQTWNANNCTNGLIGTPQIEITGTDARWSIPGSYFPQDGSNVIDNGYSAISEYTTDYYNIQRTQGSGWDIGAVEYVTGGVDVTSPNLVGAVLNSTTSLRLSFSEQLNSSAAQNISNYTINNGIAITSASVSGSQVTLTTSAHSSGNYVVTVNNVTDLAGNVINPNQNTAAYNYTPGDVTPPNLLGAVLNNPTSLTLNFSEQLNSSAAQNINNYTINNGISVTAASINGLQVTLTTTAHTSGNYIVTVNNVTDLAGNVINPSNNSASYNYSIVDVTPPQVVSAAIIDSVKLNVYFSENLDPNTAQNINNYNIAGINITGAILNSNIVTLSTSVHSNGTYTVIVNNVKDIAGNIIDPQQNSAIYEYIPSVPGQMKLPVSGVLESVVPEPQHNGEKTIDGNGYYQGDPDSRWSGDTMPEWLVYDLGDVQIIHQSKLSFYNWNAGRIYNYSLQVSSDSIQWSSVRTNIPSALEEWSIEEIGPIEARFIKVIFVANNQNAWAGLWESEFWGHLKVPTNIEDEEITPTSFVLEQNYPNPFNPSTMIRFSLPSTSNVRLTIYNTLGELIMTLAEGNYEAGTYDVEFSASGISSGIYFYRIEAGNFAETKKMIVMK